MARHAAGDGMDRVLDVDALLLEQLGELAHVVLRLRDREPVARHDDDLAREGELHGDVLGASSARTVRPSSTRRPVPAPACTWPNAPKRTFATERFIAFAISSVSSVPEAPTSIPATIRSSEFEDEAGRGRGEARERVQQRDHDRHVRAADRQHEHHAEDQRERRSAR